MHLNAFVRSFLLEDGEDILPFSNMNFCLTIKLTGCGIFTDNVMDLFLRDTGKWI